MSTASAYITVAGLGIDVIYKDIKNLHLGVYPPAGRVRVAAPLGPAGVVTAWAIFPVVHAAHGAGFAAGLQLDWTLFDGFERDAARKTADAQAASAALHGDNMIGLRNRIEGLGGTVSLAARVSRQGRVTMINKGSGGVL